MEPNEETNEPITEQAAPAPAPAPPGAKDAPPRQSTREMDELTRAGHRIYVYGPDGRRVYVDHDASKPAPDQEPGEQDGPVAPDAPLPPLPEAAFALNVEDLPLTSSQREAAQEYAGDLAAIATEIGMPAHDAQELLTTSLDVAAGLLANGGAEVNLADADACYQTMVARWGRAETEQIVKLANQTVARMPRRVRDWLDAETIAGDKIGNHPGVVFALACHAKGLTSMNREEATRALDNLKKSPEYQKGSKYHSDQAAVLGRRAFPAEGGGPRPRQAAPAVPSRAETIKAELHTLRTDPAYTDKSRPNHKAVLARVQAIYASMGDE